MAQSDFEKWYKERYGFYPVKGSFGNYLYAEQQASWVAWQEQQQEIDRLRAVLAELDESSEYWSEYDVPLGIVGRIKAALEEAK